MEVHFKPETQAKLARMAAEHHSDPDDYVQQLVENYLDHDDWFRAQVREGLNQPDQGTYITHEEIGPRIERMFRS